jgi:hypothetical protein
MTGTTARTFRPKDASAMRTMVVGDDREVMRLGLVEMLQAMQCNRPERLQLPAPRMDIPRWQLGAQLHRHTRGHVRGQRA